MILQYTRVYPKTLFSFLRPLYYGSFKITSSSPKPREGLESQARVRFPRQALKKGSPLIFGQLPESPNARPESTCVTASTTIVILVAEWIHFTLFGIILPTIKGKCVHFGGLMNSATKLCAMQQYDWSFASPALLFVAAAVRQFRIIKPCSLSNPIQ